MFLCDALAPQAGFIPRTIVCLFAALDEAAKKNPNMEITVKVSYVEVCGLACLCGYSLECEVIALSQVYMEVIRDLLEPSSINLEVRRC